MKLKHLPGAGDNSKLDLEQKELPESGTGSDSVLEQESQLLPEREELSEIQQLPESQQLDQAQPLDESEAQNKSQEERESDSCSDSDSDNEEESESMHGSESDEDPEAEWGPESGQRESGNQESEDEEEPEDEQHSGSESNSYQQPKSSQGHYRHGGEGFLEQIDGQSGAAGSQLLSPGPLLCPIGRVEITVVLPPAPPVGLYEILDRPHMHSEDQENLESMQRSESDEQPGTNWGPDESTEQESKEEETPKDRLNKSLKSGQGRHCRGEKEYKNQLAGQAGETTNDQPWISEPVHEWPASQVEISVVVPPAPPTGSNEKFNYPRSKDQEDKV